MLPKIALPLAASLGEIRIALDPALQKTLRDYVASHVADEAWHEVAFEFIKDPELRQRLAEEFMATRYVYKLLEAIEATDWLQRSQIRIQILSYASIYEAVLHYVLFDLLPSNPEVQALLEYNTLKRISIPAASQAVLEKHLAHDGKAIIPAYQGVGRSDQNKVRFDAKAICAMELGVIDEAMKNDLVEFYEARNAIHIHAEIRKGLQYELDLSKRAYRRMQPFREQVTAFLTDRGL